MRTKLYSNTAALGVSPADPADVASHEQERAFVQELHDVRVQTEPRELREWRTARQAIRDPKEPT